MTESIPEHRTPDMSEDGLILHVRGKLPFLRKSLEAGNISPRVFSLSRAYVIEELRRLRQLSVIGKEEVNDYHERERAFEDRLFEPFAEESRVENG